MRHRSDEEFRNMPCENLMTTLNNINEYKEGESADKMRARLKKIERTRHVKIWHDLSTIANHGHLVFMVSCLYDPAIHYSNDEYYRITNMTEDIQTRLETPKVYIVARSGISDFEQLTYIDTRLECLEDMAIKVKTKVQLVNLNLDSRKAVTIIVLAVVQMRKMSLRAGLLLSLSIHVLDRRTTVTGSARWALWKNKFTGKNEQAIEKFEKAGTDPGTQCKRNL